MPLFTNSDLRADPFHKTDKWRAGVGLGDYLGAVAEDAWEGLPSVGLVRLGQVAAGQVKAAGMNLELDENSMPIIKPGESQMAILPEEEQKKLIESAGLTGQVKPQPGYGRETLQLIMDRKQAELARRTTREDASNLFAPLGFATELAMGLVDPINVASAFVPVVSEARALRLLARHSSTAGRAGVRAGIGAVEGAVGALALEPITWLSQTRQQLDYDMSDSLLNVAFGAAFGAALQPATGAVGDYLRARRGQRQPWQIVADNEASRDLMQKHMQRIRDARIASGTEERRAAEEAQAAAALFDARARTWAYDFNRPVAEFYDRYMPNYRAMDAARLGDAEARLAEEMGVIASSQVQPAQKRKRRKAGQSVTVQVPEEVQFSGENVWRPANRPQYTEEQLAARRARSTLPEDDAANWLETPRGRYGIRYEVWELADLLPSNDPFNQFQRTADYPPTAQERAYHKNQNEQDKVRRNAVNLNPRYLVTDSPDASSGPPVVTTDGIVLGGNSRTMSMQLAFTKPEKLQEYKDYLASRSQLYGIEPETFSGMQAPVLVRVLQGGAMSQDEMAIASNAFNQTSTEELDVVAEGVSKSRRIDSRILTEIGSALENFDTLREYMASTESRPLVTMLTENEIIAPNQVGRMVDQNGLLTDTGKNLLESALRGLIVQDYDILASASENVASVLNKIDRAIISLVQLKRVGGKWDLSGVITKALQQINRADASMPNFRLIDLPGYFASGDLGGVDPDKALRSVQAIALTLANKQTSGREAAARFGLMATIAEKERKESTEGSLMGAFGGREAVTPEQAFIKSFLDPVVAVGNDPILNFDPKNIRHAAIQWAGKDGVTKVSDATKRLEKLITDDKLSDDERNTYREYYNKLGEIEGEKSVAVYQPKVGEFFSYDPNADRLWQTAYHGSPFRFDSFSTEHIGEGEGAQVHGWGLYFTKNKKIGEKYRKTLKKRGEQGQLFSVDIPENNVLLDEQKTFSKQNKNVKDLLYKAIESFSSNEEDRFYEKLLEERFDDNTELENARKELDRLSTQQKSFLIAMSPKGPAFLANRANLKSQGFSDEQIQQFINNPEMGIEEAKKLTPVVRAVQEKVDALATQDRERRAAIIQEAKEDFGKTLENVTGRKLYAAIAYALSDNSYKYESKEASLWLNKHGIKGITYMGDTDGRCFVVFDDKAVEVLRTFYQGQDTSAPRARVIFDDAAASKAVIEFFSAADASSAPHELYHVFRREMAESAARPDAPQRVRDDWARIEAFVGAQPGQAWTREMEEKFAKAGERYLLEGVAPYPALTGVFERLKQWFLELYANADAAGLNISPAMREVFGRMFSTPAEQGDKAFRYALGDLLSRRVDPVEEPLADEVSASTAENIEEYMAMAADDLNRSLTDLDTLDPQASSQIRDAYIEEETALNTEIERRQLETSVMVEAARCDVRYN